MGTSADSDLTIVTGAASGMGEAAAGLMAAEGRSLLLCDRDEARLAQAAQRLGGQVATLAGDISDPAYGAQLIAALGDRRIAAVVHCAGLSPSMADAARILDVNLAATMRLVAAIEPLMAEGSAAVLFASSAAHMMGSVLDPQIRQATTPEAAQALVSIAADSGTAYSVSKRGVQLLVQREAGRFGARGARLISISPGIIDTPMGRTEERGQPVIQQMVQASALRREARPSEVAAVAAFLCSPAASFITGVDILVDGGAVAGLATR